MQDNHLDQANFVNNELMQNDGCLENNDAFIVLSMSPALHNSGPNSQTLRQPC